MPAPSAMSLHRRPPIVICGSPPTTCSADIVKSPVQPNAVAPGVLGVLGVLGAPDACVGTPPPPPHAVSAAATLITNSDLIRESICIPLLVSKKRITTILN